MNTKLIFQLSIFGFVMALATVYLIPTNQEPWYWLIIFIVCAYLIARRSDEKYFLSGLFVSLLNAVWITTFHILLFDSYMETHEAEIEMMNKMPIPDSPRLMMLLTGPVVGLLSGVILGLFALIAAKIVNRNRENW